MTVQVVAFLGLGRMGFPMASHLHRAAERVLVWNRTEEKALRHAKEHGSTAVVSLDEVAEAEIIFTCLPTSKEVDDMVKHLEQHLRAGTVLVDCTSGEPEYSRAIAERLEKQGVGFVDAPVSGGPRGAEAGSLTVMAGGRVDMLEKAKPVIETFAQKIVHAGERAGCGHALKSINNCLNSAHLAVAAEGLLALQKLGIRPSVALEAINTSSGRSLATEKRMPERILSRTFDHGFAISLMQKDVKIGTALLERQFPQATVLPQIAGLLDRAVESVGPDADYTCLVKHIESLAGAELH